MAEKRMYSKKITETDDFLSLPLSTQALYFHLGMNADDDGFVSSPVKVMRMIGANKNELDLLLVKKYLIPFDNGVVVIRHWRINNYLRSDRYNPTIYTNEKKQLVQLENGSYELKQNCGIPVVDQLATQYSIDKNSIDKESVEEVKSDEQVTTTSSQKRKIFIPPSLEEVKSFCEERRNNIDAENFIAFYQSKGWKVGNQAMKDWKSALITWEKRNKNKQLNTNEEKQAKYSKDELNLLFANLDYSDIG